MPGKKLISKFLAKQLKYVDLKNNLIVDIDSEAYLSECECQNDDHCQCDLYATPVRFYFKKESGYDREELMHSIKQRKGEAEMSQADWLFDKNTTENLTDGQCVVNFVTSADIDTLVIHLLSVSMFWPRNEVQSFKWPVFLWLQKKKPEIYDITGIISLLEKHFNKPKIRVLVACILAMGGNDFLPNFHSISHDKLLSTAMKNGEIRENLVTTFTAELENGEKKVVYTLDKLLYTKLYATLYCPPKVDSTALTFAEIRQLSIKLPGKEFKHPHTWLPPTSALDNLADLVQLQLDYFATIGLHSASLPNFISKGCLNKLQDNSIKINLGEDVFVSNRSLLLSIDEKELLIKLKTE
ncbi:Hypothetical predicted protein [Mytilus galloprovincialis]|uniref:Uncharacterized protein n=1 Tax=Mytilus galloprovincialis TaxID=29158 RepID=A0A8B6G9S6_MYTGA|nr:Hypothetical predicted protein [Mytilus galloprovincialis]